jgi:hypothetical protein
VRLTPLARRASLPHQGGGDERNHGRREDERQADGHDDAFGRAQVVLVARIMSQQPGDSQAETSGSSLA